MKQIKIPSIYELVDSAYNELGLKIKYIKF
jgi:hypothetical protein